MEEGVKLLATLSVFNSLFKSQTCSLFSFTRCLLTLQTMNHCELEIDVIQTTAMFRSINPIFSSVIHSVIIFFFIFLVDEPSYVKQLKQLRWGHLKHIQKEIRQLEDLERFLDTCQSGTFISNATNHLK